jgi:excinuclease ABC subunit C
MQELRQQVEHFPHKPGCYLFKDAAGVVLYVGKAKDLRKRAGQYFGQDKRPQLPFLVD